MPLGEQEARFAYELPVQLQNVNSFSYENRYQYMTDKQNSLFYKMPGIASKFPVFINYKSDDLQIILYILQIIKHYILRDIIKEKCREKM